MIFSLLYSKLFLSPGLISSGINDINFIYYKYNRIHIVPYIFLFKIFSLYLSQ